MLDTRKIQIWIAEGPNIRLNLVGVGNLTGKESSLRLLVEMGQIFSEHKSWFGLCRGLASGVDQLLLKQTDPQEAPDEASHEARDDQAAYTFVTYSPT